MKRLNWFEILLIVIVMGMSLYAALSDAQNLSMRWFTRDDAYYYFKVAQNISEGHGSTFDGINRTNGYHPLWLLICIPIFALARFDLILPLRVLLLVMSGLSLGTAILLYRLIGKVFAPAIGAIAAIYWVFNRDILTRVYQQGLETGIAAFCIVLLIYKLFEFEKSWREKPVTNKQLVTLGALAMLVMFSRLDLVFLAGIAGIWIMFRKYPMRYFLPLDIVYIIVSVLLALILRITFDGYYKYSDVAMVMIVVSLLVKIPGAYLIGLYQRSNVKTMLGRLLAFSVLASTVTGIIMIGISRLSHFEGFPRSAILYDMLITIILLGITRLGAIGLRTDQPGIKSETSPIKQFTANWKTWLTEGAIYYGILFGLLAVYMLWNKIAFGTFSPVSGQIKRWWGSLPGQVYGGAARYITSFFGLDPFTEGNAWHPVSTFFGNWAEQINTTRISDLGRYMMLLAAFVLVFYFILWINKSKARNAIVQLGIIPLLASTWIQILSYHITGYSAFKEWYWVAQLVVIVLVANLVGGMIQQAVRKYPASNAALWLIAIGIGAYMGSSYWDSIKHVMPYNATEPNTPYNDIAALLEENTEPGSIIGMTGGGNAGYFIHDRTVVNMDGLINSYEYFQLLKDKKAGEYLAEIGMDYILANPYMLNDLPYRKQFAPYIITETNIRYGGKDLVQYRQP